MKRKTLKKAFSAFLSLLMCMMTLLSISTPVFAATTVDAYMVDFPRDGDSNYSATCSGATSGGGVSATSWVYPVHAMPLHHRWWSADSGSGYQSGAGRTDGTATTSVGEGSSTGGAACRARTVVSIRSSISPPFAAKHPVCVR